MKRFILHILLSSPSINTQDSDVEINWDYKTNPRQNDIIIQ